MKFNGPIDRKVSQFFSKRVDCYLWNGINVARQWPRGSRAAKSPAQQHTRDAFKTAMQQMHRERQHSHTGWRFPPPNLPE